MNSIAFSAATLTDEQALELAQAYVKGDKDPLRIARILGVDSFDLNAIMHPLTRGHIVRLHRATSAEHSLADHMAFLKKIRNAAFDDDNFKVALAAETQLGKAAGHYDPKPAGDDSDPTKQLDPTKLTSDELRRRLASTIGAVIPAPKQEALPGSVEAQEAEDRDGEI
jgi:hypothetical protein